VRVAPQHLLSVSRLVLGVHVLGELGAAPGSATALGAVLLACAADYFDGIVARRSGTATTAGRLLDNLCDVVFLALVFAGAAGAGVWSGALGARAWAHAIDWLLLAALAGSFGSYLLRWSAASARGAAPRPSALGHRAGIANYGLAIVAAASVTPGVVLPAWFLAASFVVVVALNVAALVDNTRLLAAGERDAVRGAGHRA
jgi:phosphatidylglycerophosphate synthase